MRTMNSTAEMVARVKELRERSFHAPQTLQQLREPNPYIMGSWGAREFAKVADAEYPQEDGALIFKVKANYFTGVICITLGWEDLYKVHFFEAKGKGLTERDDLNLTGVYCDVLTNEIDKLIESKPPSKGFIAADAADL